MFVPSRIPLREENVYFSRGTEQQLLLDYAEEGAVSVVFGDFGVGKTTVVRRVFQDAEDDGRLVYFQAEAESTLEDLSNEIYSHFGTLREVELVRRVSEKARLGMRPAVVDGEGAFDTKYEYVNSLPTPAELQEVLETKNALIVIDEVHVASDEFRQFIVRLVKAARANASPAPTIVVVGTSEDPHLLGKLDRGSARYFREVPVKLLEDEDIQYIVTEGFSRLEMVLDQEVATRIVAMSAGAPAIAQRLCLESAKAATRRGASSVTPMDLVTAIRDYTHSQQIALTRKYARSIERQGKFRYRKQILRAMAESANDEVATEEITDRVSEQLGRDVPSSSLSGKLRQLKEGPDPILCDVDRGESREHGLSRFVDPMMKSYIRFLLAAGDEAIIDLIEAEGGDE